MEYIKPIDPVEFMDAASKELNKCVTHYFREISLEEAANPEILDVDYTEDYLERVIGDYYRRLSMIWERSPLAAHARFSAVYRVPSVSEIGDPDELAKAHRDASRRTLWERLTRTNHKDVFEYKQMLNTYGEALLNTMLERFADAIIAVNR